MRIGILGGTFDPIHFGHIKLGIYAHQHMNLDEIWFMPNRYPPHKEITALNDSHLHRGEMIRLVVEDVPYFKYCDYEITRDEVSYTYLTMEALKSMYPNHEFYFIIGSDSLFTFDTWNEPQRILNNCNLLVAARTVEDSRHILEISESLMLKYSGTIEVVIMPVFPVSSTSVRQMLLDEKNCEFILPKSVIDYIEVNDLYRSK